MAEPGSISFKETPAEPASADTARVPGSLTFVPASSQKAGTKQVPPAIDSPPPEVGALTFKVSRPVGSTVFASAAHPLLDTVLAEIARKSPDVYASEAAALKRYVTKLLPLTVQAVEQFGLRVLEESRDNVLQAVRLTEHYQAINASALISSLVADSPASTGLLGIFSRKKISVDQAKSALEATLVALREFLPTVRAAYTEDRSKKLANYLLAISSVADNWDLVSDTTLERSVRSKQGTLQSALVQAQMLPSQLKGLEDSAMSNLAQCEKLLYVGISALGLGRRP